MNHQKKKLRVKGFTLVEMVTVIAIIGILLGILTPAMMSYIRKSRLSEANSDAKLVYNAAQTAAQKYIISERSQAATDRVFYGKQCWIAYEANGHNILGISGPDPSALTAIDSLSSDNEKESFRTIVSSVNNVVSGGSSVNWAVCVDNYIVKASVSATMPTSRYIGSFTSSPDANKRNQSEMSSGNYQSQYLTVLKAAAAQYGNS